MKRIIPIQSGNIKYLGLSIPEWCIVLIPAVFYIILLEGIMILITAIIHAILITIYVKILSKLEENIFAVLVSNLKIPSVIQGYSLNVKPDSEHTEKRKD